MEAARGRLRRCRGLKGMKTLQICEIFILGYIQDTQTVFTKSIALEVVVLLCFHIEGSIRNSTSQSSHKASMLANSTFAGMAKIYFIFYFFKGLSFLVLSYRKY